MGTEVAEALVDPLAFRLGYVQVLKVPNDAVDTIAFEFVSEDLEALGCGVAFSEDELAEIM